MGNFHAVTHSTTGPCSECERIAELEATLTKEREMRRCSECEQIVERIHDSEKCGLRQRVVELETRLAEAERERDETEELYKRLWNAAIENLALIRSSLKAGRNPNEQQRVG